MADEINLIGNNIRYLRKKNKWSQEELASQLNLKRSNIAAYESKNVEPRLYALLKIAKVFTISIDQFLTERLDDHIVLQPFEKNKPTKYSKIQVAGQEKINSLIEKSLNVNKMLEGFKAFYRLKKKNLDPASLEFGKINMDIDNFIELIEQLLYYNETVIRFISENQFNQKMPATNS